MKRRKLTSHRPPRRHNSKIHAPEIILQRHMQRFIQILIHIRQKLMAGGTETDQGSVSVDGGAVVVESNCYFAGRGDGVGEWVWGERTVLFWVTA